MKSFKQFVVEDCEVVKYVATQNSSQVLDDSMVLQINNRFTNALAGKFITAQIALEQVRKVLAPYFISVQYVNLGHSSVVHFSLEHPQNTKHEKTRCLRFEWETTEDGYIIAHAAIIEGGAVNEESLWDDDRRNFRPLLNPKISDVSHLLQLSAYKTLRYLKFKNKIWVWDASMTLHGTAAGFLGIRRQWDEEHPDMRTGFIHEQDLNNINDLSQWIMNRHTKAGKTYIEDTPDYDGYNSVADASRGGYGGGSNSRYRNEVNKLMSRIRAQNIGMGP